MARDYHHGDLPTALRSSAVELIAERGPASFSLREVARRAGVSHAAPAHHFGDARGLISSVAAEGFTALAKALSDAKAEHDHARDKFIACGRAYITMALENPGHYTVMIGHGYINRDDPELLLASVNAYEELLGLIGALQREYNEDLDIDATALLIWSMVHGLVELVPLKGHLAESTGTTDNPLDTLLEHMADMLIEGLRAP